MLNVGIDIGGTFTDIVVYNEATPPDLLIFKVPTTSEEPEKAVVETLNKYRDSSRQVQLIIHATTVGTNALLTHQDLAKTALITNEGFRDVLEIGRQRRPEIYNLLTQRPSPLVKRRDRFTIRGRIAADGRELEPIKEINVKAVTKKILTSRFEAVAISLLHSYAYPEQERRTRSLLKKAGFKGRVDISSEVDPGYREYERTSTTVVNSVLSRPVSTYLARLQRKLMRAGFRCPLYVMNSDGTASTIAQASRRPVSVIESGPAAGMLASSSLAISLGIRRVLSFDMGGTTAKAGAIINARPDFAYEFEAAARTYHGRSVKGGGYPVRQPFIDLAEVSAGGGTLARADEIGNLKVGPESAGADPGPAAYGRGGKLPTLTDANIVAGRINPSKLLGGALKLHYDLAIRAVGRVSRSLGTSIEKTAEDIIRIVNNNMSKALSLVTIERGRDPREYDLVAFGGAGPLHACDLAEELEIKRIVIPAHPGLFSAFGLLSATLSKTFSEPIMKPTTVNLEPYFAKLREVARESLKQEGFADYRAVEQIDLRYQGQAFEITVPYKKNSNLVKLFGREHKKLYGYSSKDPVEAVNGRVRTIIPKPTARFAKSRLTVFKTPITPSSRRVRVAGSWCRVPVYDRESLPPGFRGTGPGIIEEYDATSMIGTNWSWAIDQYANILISRPKNP